MPSILQVTGAVLALSMDFEAEPLREVRKVGSGSHRMSFNQYQGELFER